MDKLEYAIRSIENCNLCDGVGSYTWSNGEDFDFETCECNPYELILDESGDVIWDNSLLSEPELGIFETMEAN